MDSDDLTPRIDAFELEDFAPALSSIASSPTKKRLCAISPEDDAFPMAVSPSCDLHRSTEKMIGDQPLRSPIVTLPTIDSADYIRNVAETTLDETGTPQAIRSTTAQCQGVQTAQHQPNEVANALVAELSTTFGHLRASFQTTISQVTAEANTAQTHHVQTAQQVSPDRDQVIWEAHQVSQQKIGGLQRVVEEQQRSLGNLTSVNSESRNREPDPSSSSGDHGLSSIHPINGACARGKGFLFGVISSPAHIQIL